MAFTINWDGGSGQTVLDFALQHLASMPSPCHVEIELTEDAEHPSIPNGESFVTGYLVACEGTQLAVTRDLADDRGERTGGAADVPRRPRPLAGRDLTGNR